MTHSFWRHHFHQRGPFICHPILTKFHLHKSVQRPDFSCRASENRSQIKEMYLPALAVPKYFWSNQCFLSWRNNSYTITPPQPFLLVHSITGHNTLLKIVIFVACPFCIINCLPSMFFGELSGTRLGPTAVTSSCTPHNWVQPWWRTRGTVLESFCSTGCGWHKFCLALDYIRRQHRYPLSCHLLSTAHCPIWPGKNSIHLESHGLKSINGISKEVFQKLTY